MSDTSLFKPEEVRIEPAPDRHEPVVWVRRLVIVEERTAGVTPLREVEFHRGLNIIATEVATESDTEPVGHNVGKTLLTRLIRFCLGEAHFADAATRAAVRQAFPLGYVLAEIVINGECWCVARPIGAESSRNAWACQGSDWHVMLGESERLLGFDAFREALETATAHDLLGGISLPSVERPIRWLELLAWLSRDQYCRYRHPHEWRSAEADSGTANPAKDDAAFLVRACLGLIDSAEQKIIAERRAAVRQREEAERARHNLDRRLGYVRENLIRSLEMSNDAIPGPAFGHAARQQAEQRLKRLQGLLDAIVNDPTLSELEQAASAAAAAFGERSGELNQLRARRTEEATRLKQAQTASRGDFYASFADPAAHCPAGSCPMKQSSASGEEPWREQEIQTLRDQLADRDAEIGKYEIAKQAAERDLDAARKKESEKRIAVLKDRAAIERQIGVLESLVDEGGRFGQWQDDLDRLDAQVATSASRIEQLRDQQRQAQERLADTRRRFGEYFDYVVKALVGDAVRGTLDLTLRGLELSLDDEASSTGEALSTSSKVLSLDLASLIGSVCGLGVHPRFIVHDSPREADLEPHIYGRLFRLVYRVQRLCGERVSFQYIVTTTTPPPPELSGAPHVVCSLHRRSEAGLLLGRRI